MGGTVWRSVAGLAIVWVAVGRHVEAATHRRGVPVGRPVAGWKNGCWDADGWEMQRWKAKTVENRWAW